MAPLRPGQAYTATYQLTNAQRLGYKYKDIENIIRQQTRPHMDIPARTKKGSIIRIWCKQDRLIAERDGHDLPQEEENEEDAEMNDAGEGEEANITVKLSDEVKAAYRLLVDEAVEIPTAQAMKDDMDRWRVAYKGCRNKEELKQRWAPAWAANKDNDKNKKSATSSSEVTKKRKRDRDGEDEDLNDEEPSKFQKTEHTKTTQKALIAEPTASKRKRSSDGESSSQDTSHNRAPKRTKSYIPPTPEQIAKAEALVSRIRSNLDIFYKRFEPRLADTSMSLLERVRATDLFNVELPEAYFRYKYDEYDNRSDVLSTEQVLMGILGEKALLKAKPNDEWTRAIEIGTGIAARRLLGMGRRGLKMRQGRKGAAKNGRVKAT